MGGRGRTRADEGGRARTRADEGGRGRTSADERGRARTSADERRGGYMCDSCEASQWHVVTSNIKKYK